jgi:hypothetical protein
VQRNLANILLIIPHRYSEFSLFRPTRLCFKLGKNEKKKKLVKEFVYPVHPLVLFSFDNDSKRRKRTDKTKMKVFVYFVKTQNVYNEVEINNS